MTSCKFNAVNVCGINGAHVYNAKNYDVWCESKKNPENFGTVSEFLVNGVQNFLIGGTTIWKGIAGYHKTESADPMAGFVSKSLIDQINDKEILLKKKIDCIPNEIQENNFRFDDKKEIEFNLGSITKKHVIK